MKMETIILNIVKKNLIKTANLFINAIGKTVLFLLFLFFFHTESKAQNRDGVTINGPQLVCSNSDGETYSVTGFSIGDEIEWSIEGTGGSINGANNQSTVLVIWTNTGSSNLSPKVKVTVTSESGTQIDDHDITLFPNTQITIDTNTECSLFVGNNGQYSITAVGGDDLSYEWYEKAPERADFTKIITSNNFYIEGTWTTNTLKFKPLNTDYNGYEYYCIVHSNCGTDATSSTKTLNIYTPPDITSDPDPIAVCENSEATFSVQALGDALSYQWVEIKPDGDTLDITDSTHYSGCTTDTLRILQAPDVLNKYKYKCKVTSAPVNNLIRIVISDTATLTVYPIPHFNEGAVIAVPELLCQGDTVTFLADSIPETTYHWKLPDDTWVITSDSTSHSLRVKVGDSAGDLTVYASSINGCGNSETLTDSLQPGALPKINNPENLTAYADLDGNAQFDPIVVEHSTTYDWKVSIDSIWHDIGSYPDYEPVYDTNNPNQLRFSGVYPSHDSTLYKCIAVGCGGSEAESGIFTLYQQSQFEITVSPSTQSYCIGDSVKLFSELNTTLKTQYNWYKNDTLINLQTDSELTQQSSYSGEITFVVSASKFPGVSDTISIHINALPEFGINNDAEFCQNQKGIMLHISEPDPNLSYTWSPGDGIEAWSDTAQAYLIVNFGKANPAFLTIAAQDRTTKCENSQSKTIQLGTMVPEMPDRLEWENKGDHILVFNPDPLLKEKSWDWGYTLLSDFSDKEIKEADSLNYHDFYPTVVPNPGTLFWVEFISSVKDACNARYYYNVPMQFKYSLPEETPEHPLKVFPNPATGLIYLDPGPVENSEGELQYQVYDMRGTLLKIGKLNPHPGSPVLIDLSAFPSGLYLLRVFNNKGFTGNSRIIIAK